MLRRKRRNPSPKAIGQALRDWRYGHELQSELVAACCRRTVVTIGRWERGVGSPTMRDVLLLERRWPGLFDSYRHLLEVR